MIMEPMLIISFVCMVLCIMLTATLVSVLVWRVLKRVIRLLEIRIFDTEAEYDSTSIYD
tara:strand:+ start:1051 stop:1227 length:177 start_codon:yes stop_codon:yes gene_type:complete